MRKISSEKQTDNVTPKESQEPNNWKLYQRLTDIMHRANVSRRLFAAAEEENFEQYQRADTIHTTLASMEQDMENNYDLHAEIQLPQALYPAHAAAMQLAEERRQEIANGAKLEPENQMNSSPNDT